LAALTLNASSTAAIAKLLMHSNLIKAKRKKYDMATKHFQIIISILRKSTYLPLYNFL
jgi:hypothetical protein